MIKLMLLMIFMMKVSLSWAGPVGSDLYAQHCAICHGSNGKGGVGVPLALPSFLDSVSNEYLSRSIHLGRPGRVMPAFAELSEAEITAIVQHIRGWSKQKAPVFSGLTIKGDKEKGGQLFQQHCAVCHGVDAQGGTGTGVTYSRPRDHVIIAPALANAGFLGAASDEMIKQTLMNGRKGSPMISFIEQGLSEREIEHVVAYVRSLQSQIKEQPKKKLMPAYLKYESEENIELTLLALKKAAVGANFRIIREQYLEQGLIDKGKEDKKKIVLYFCNFNMLNKALAIDPRVGLFLPCRVTLIEKNNKVSMITVNPAAMSQQFNNDELNRLCEEMAALYKEILEEAAL